MGRGLSRLQKEILQMAYRNRQNFDQDETERLATPYMGRTRLETPDDLHSHEAMVELFDCVPSEKQWSARCSSGRLMRRFGGWQVSIQESGETRYRSASVSVHRAFNRLEARGLVIRPYHGVISLTDDGIEAAKSLSNG